MCAQPFSLKGNITDAATGNALSNASIFLSNTSYGTTSRENGEFELNNIDAGKYDLVVTFIGYETFTETVSEKASSEKLVIKLKPKSDDLKDVVVKSFDPDGWTKWGKFFLDNFIGTSSYALGCTLKNSKAVRFHFSKTKNELTAFANETLVIENDALGYILKYQLEDFSYNYNTKYLSYEGYPFFQEMDGNERRKNKWEKARKDVYQLSLMYFMRSLFRNTMLQNGYVLYPLKRIPNLERERMEAKQKAYYAINKPLVNGNFESYESTLKKDSLAYFSTIMRQPDPFEIISKQIMNGDSIAYAEDSLTAALDFPDYLLVRLPKAAVPSEYAPFIQAGQPISSVLSLTNKKPVLVNANGYFYEIYDLLVEGFWEWWEKIATMLPYNYYPRANNL